VPTLNSTQDGAGLRRVGGRGRLDGPAPVRGGPAGRAPGSAAGPWLVGHRQPADPGHRDAGPPGGLAGPGRQRLYLFNQGDILATGSPASPSGISAASSAAPCGACGCSPWASPSCAVPPVTPPRTPPPPTRPARRRRPRDPRSAWHAEVCPPAYLTNFRSAQRTSAPPIGSVTATAPRQRRDGSLGTSFSDRHSSRLMRPMT
jgi:hypothetical protein